MTKKITKYPIPIREWSEDDRPREKLLKYGEHTPLNVYPVKFEDYLAGALNYSTGGKPI